MPFIWTGSTLALALGLMNGCSSSQAEQQRAAEAREAEMRFVLGPLVDDNGHHRSLTLDSPEMAELRGFQPWLDDRTAWYHDRLDRRPGVNAGTRRSILIVSETITRDRFSSSNGKVQDNYSQNVTRDKVFEVVR